MVACGFSWSSDLPNHFSSQFILMWFVPPLPFPPLSFVLFLLCLFLLCPFLPFLISTGKDCPQGTYSTSAKNAKDSDCTNCGTGTYSTTLAADQESQCLTCRVSKYSPNVGADQESACQNCVLGFEQSLQGMSYCLPCTPGSYGKADENGYAICEKCPNNYYSNAITETSCETCPTGRISDIGSVSCSLCPAGWKVDGLGCTSCMPGTYQPGMEKSDCLDCE